MEPRLGCLDKRAGLQVALLFSDVLVVLPWVS